MLTPPLIVIYTELSGKLLSSFLIISVMSAGAFGNALSAFNPLVFRYLRRLLSHLLISCLLCLYILTVKNPEVLSPGQKIADVFRIRGIALNDGREIGGGQKVFDLELKYSEDFNSTTTSSSGRITVVSPLNVFKGQQIIIEKRNLLQKQSSLIFVDAGGIKVEWCGKGFSEYINKTRAELLGSLKQRIRHMPMKPAILFTALFTGIKEDPKNNLFISLRRAGASHILALSGMHLGIISLGIMLVLKKFLDKRVSFLVTFLAALFYLWITGAGPSLVRSVILFALAGILVLSGGRIGLFHILTLCFLIQIILFPGSTSELSFQLSYLALYGIILLSGSIKRFLPGFLPEGLRGIFGASVSAQLFTSPLVLYSFGLIYPVGILSSIILVPAVTIFIWTGILSLFPGPWILRSLLFKLSSLLYSVIDYTAVLFSQFPALGLRGTLVIVTTIVLLLFVCRIARICNK